METAPNWAVFLWPWVGTADGEARADILDSPGRRDAIPHLL
jgi:hypothetical protein